MTLTDKTKFIDDLIQENPDITISEYLFALQEIETVEKATRDMPYERITPEQEQKIIELAETGDYKQIMAAAGVGVRTLYKYLKKAEINLKEIRVRNRVEWDRLEGEARLAAIKARQLPELIPEPKVPTIPKKVKANVRPPAIYSNSRPYDSLHQNQKTE